MCMHDLETCAIIIAGDFNAHLGTLAGPRGTGTPNSRGLLSLSKFLFIRAEYEYTICIYYVCTTEAIEIKGTAPSVCTLRKLIMVYEYAWSGIWSYSTREGVWLSQQIHCKHCSLWLP